MSLIPLPFWLMLPTLCAFGAWVLGWLADRTTRNQQLRDILLASFWVRVGLAIVLFVISYWHLPILKSLQFGDGLWTFAGDAQAYHAYGQTMSQSWWRGESAILPEARIFPYSFIVAVIYWLFGPHLLYGVLFNVWCGAGCGLLAYLIAERTIGERARLPAAWLVAFWPSSLLWSTQLLKDVLTLTLLLTALALSIWWAQEARQNHPTRRTSERAGSWCGLVLAVMWLTLLRFYVGFTLLATTALVIGAAMIRSAFQGRFRESSRLVGLVASMAIAVLMARVSPLANPPSPSLQMNKGSALMETDMGALGSQSENASATTTPPARTTVDALTKALLQRRAGFTTTGGHALIDGETELSDFGTFLRYFVTRAAIVALLAPFPSQWFDWGGSTGIMRLYSATEMVLIYVLVPSMIWGLGLVFRRCERGGMLLATFAVCLLIQVAIVVTNVGTLFRLRLLFLFPLLIMAAGGGVLGPYQTVGRWLLRLVGNHHTGASDLHREGRRADSEDQLAAKS